MLDSDVADLKAKISRIENNLRIIGNIVINGAAIAIALCVREIVEHYDTIRGYGVAAAIGTGMAILKPAAWERTTAGFHQ
jgi:hypothetical protein